MILDVQRWSLHVKNSLDYAAGLYHSSFQSYRSRLDWRKLMPSLYLWLMVSILAVTLHETNIAPELLGLEGESFLLGRPPGRCFIGVFFWGDVNERQSSIVAANQLHPSQALQVHKTIIPKMTKHIRGKKSFIQIPMIHHVTNEPPKLPWDLKIIPFAFWKGNSVSTQSTFGFHFS